MKLFKLPEHADSNLIRHSINNLVAGYLELDERIARFETGAAYERARSSKDGWTLSASALRCIDKIHGIVENLSISRYDKTILMTEFNRLLADMHKEEG